MSSNLAIPTNYKGLKAFLASNAKIQEVFTAYLLRHSSEITSEQPHLEPLPQSG